MKNIAVLPTLCTLAAGACGFLSILFAARITGDPAPEELRFMALAGWMIFAAMAFDTLDGHLARLSKSTSDFGGQLDSLCDVISFGVAPAFVFLRLCPEFREGGLLLIAVLYVICVVLRLARFNVETSHEPSDHLSFRGLPSPAAAGTVAAFAILLHRAAIGEIKPAAESIAQAVLPFAAIGLALLMVSRIPYPHLLNQILQGHHRFGHIVKLVFAGVLIMLIHELSLPLIFTAFAIGAPLRFFWEELVLRRPREQPLF